MQFLDTVTTQAAADQNASQYVSDHSHEKQAFTVIINGSTLIQPCHYIVADITSGRNKWNVSDKSHNSNFGL